MLASPDPEPVPNFRVGTPPNSQVTENLVGNTTPVGPRRPETIQRLAGHGITANTFQEYVRGTRFNLKYVKSLSDIVGQTTTFRIEKVCFKNLTLNGGKSQIVKSRPTETEDLKRLNERHMQTISAATSSTATMGAAYCFGFQPYKEDPRTKGSELELPQGYWKTTMGNTDGWYNNRNDRRNLPDGIGTERFRAISMQQDLQLSNVVRRMIKAQR